MMIQNLIRKKTSLISNSKNYLKNRNASHVVFAFTTSHNIKYYILLYLPIRRITNIIMNYKINPLLYYESWQPPSGGYRLARCRWCATLCLRGIQTDASPILGMYARGRPASHSSSPMSGHDVTRQWTAIVSPTPTARHACTIVLYSKTSTTLYFNFVPFAYQDGRRLRYQFVYNRVVLFTVCYRFFRKKKF